MLAAHSSRQAGRLTSTASLGLATVTGFDASHDRVANAAGADAQRVHRDGQPLGELAATLDSPTSGVAKILDGEVPLIRPKLLKAAIEELEPVLACQPLCFAVEGDDVARVRSIDVRLLVESNMPAAVPAILEQHEARDHVAIAGRRTRRNRAGLFERSRDAVQRLVGKVISAGTIAPIEVLNQPPANLQIPFAVRLDAVIQPFEQTREAEFRKYRFFSKVFLC